MTGLLGAYLHTIDPYAVKLWEGGPVRWYGLSYLLGFALAYMLIRHVVRVGRSTLDPGRVGDFILVMALGVVAGGRLGYVVLYRPELFWSFSGSAPWWGVLAINEGGMASHGGMVGALAASLWYSKMGRRADGGRGHRWLHVLDLAAFGAPLGLFFGRIANFVNAELIGRACSPDLPWAVKFPHEMYDWPAKRWEPMLTLLQGVPGVSRPAPPTLFDSLLWAVEQIQLGNQEVVQIVEPMLTPRHPSQIYQALLEGLLLFAVLVWVWTKPRRPGVVAGWFCVVYGVVRVVGEAFREPDGHIAHLEYAHWGVTRGQWLSVLLVLLGLLLLRVAVRSGAGVMGGWGGGDEGSGGGRGA